MPRPEHYSDEQSQIPPSAGDAQRLYQSCSPSVHSSYKQLGTILGILRGNKIPLLNIRPTRNLVQYLLSNDNTHPNPQNNSAKMAPPIIAKHISTSSKSNCYFRSWVLTRETLWMGLFSEICSSTALRQIHTYIDCGLFGFP